MKDWLGAQLRKVTRVYIFPTRMGGYLIGLIFLMFLLSIGYSNNLLLIFTLMLFGLNLIWVIQTHYHLNRLRLKNCKVSDGHALAATHVELEWKKKISPADWDLQLESDQKKYPIKISGHGPGKSEGEILLSARGTYQWKFLKVSTDLPFGLYKVWIYYPLATTSLAYPSLLGHQLLPYRVSGESEGQHSSERKGLEGLLGFDPYQGESAARISWKHYSKTGELVTKTGEATLEDVVELELKSPLPPDRKERVLSELATSIIQCQNQQIPFTFRGKTHKGPGHHQELVRECLRELALC